MREYQQKTNETLFLVAADIDNGQKIGAIGIILNRESPRELVQVYDLEEPN